MPKLKTQKSAAARFRFSGTGKLMRTKCGKTHMRRNRPRRAKALYDNMLVANPVDRVRVSRLIPYAGK